MVFKFAVGPVYSTVRDVRRYTFNRNTKAKATTIGIHTILTPATTSLFHLDKKVLIHWYNDDSCTCHFLTVARYRPVYFPRDHLNESAI